jgi:hypothetical protein
LPSPYKRQLHNTIIISNPCQTDFEKNVSDYRGTKLYHKNVSLVNTSVSASLWIRHPILNCLTTNFFGCAAPEKPSSPEVLTRSIRIPPPLGF